MPNASRFDGYPSKGKVFKLPLLRIQSCLNFDHRSDLVTLETALRFGVRPLGRFHWSADHLNRVTHASGTYHNLPMEYGLAASAARVLNPLKARAHLAISPTIQLPPILHFTGLLFSTPPKDDLLYHCHRLHLGADSLFTCFGNQRS